jgi:N-acetylglucosamine repressor
MVLRTGDRQLIKELNIALVLNIIRQHAPIARVDIAERTGLGRSTVTGIIATLLRENLVMEIGSAESAAGRKPVLLEFNSRALYAIGIKVGPRLATIALVDMQAVVLYTNEVALHPAQGVEVMLQTLKETVNKLLATATIPAEKVLGVGLVMPGVVDPATGTAVSSYFFHWADLPIRDLLEQSLQMPVFVDNDANAMALAEALYGAGRGATDMIGLTVGVGIGAGLVVGGQIHRGSRFAAGELGHVCVEPGGPLCACGRRGCLEAVAADGAIVRRARAEVEAGRSPLLRALAQGQLELLTREMVVEAAQAGDDAAQKILAESGRWLGMALGNAINLLSPDRIVVGGEAVLQAGELILAPMVEMLQEIAFPNADGLRIVPAALGRNAWVQGAAALVLADAFRVPMHQTDTVAMASRVGQNPL